VDGDYLKETFERLDRLGGSDSLFVFAHLILPHTPYVFDAHCGPVVAPDVRDRRPYLAQLQCANAMVLKLVTDLIRRPGERPIILLQGDHGTAMAGIFDAQSPEDV